MSCFMDALRFSVTMHPKNTSRVHRGIVVLNIRCSAHAMVQQVIAVVLNSCIFFSVARSSACNCFLIRESEPI